MIMNAPAILYEILQALKDLLTKGERHVIYINKLPITPEDRELLLDTLGRGNVRIYIDSATQPMELWETGIYGVWVGTIYDRDKKPTLEIIEIAFYPELAMSQREDVEESVGILEERIRTLLKDEKVTDSS